MAFARIENLPIDVTAVEPICDYALIGILNWNQLFRHRKVISLLDYRQKLNAERVLFTAERAIKGESQNCVSKINSVRTFYETCCLTAFGY